MMKNKILSDPNYANEILFSQIKNDLSDLCCKLLLHNAFILFPNNKEFER